ncbi:MAG: redox-regulated ATPase YchF [Bacillota bacterium]
MSTSLEVGILGLPKTGKTTLFNALTKSTATTDAYAAGSLEPNIGTAIVPDKRLDVLGAMYKTRRSVPTSMKFVDIVGLAKGASGGSGLGNRFLSHIRSADALVQVVRCFEDENLLAEDGSSDPLEQIDILNMELCLADMESIERRITRTKKFIKNGDTKLKDELAMLEQILSCLENAEPARKLGLNEEQTECIKDINMLTLKPVLFVANIGEDDIKQPEACAAAQKVIEYAKANGVEAIVVAAKLEAEISQLSDEEAAMFAEELGVTESGLDQLIRASYKQLGLISFLTAGVQETRAWTIRNGYKAPQAAGKIHSDIQRGFIRAETVAYNDLVEFGSFTAAKEKGKVRLEGKDYIVKDGDVIDFRFNV